MKERDLPEASTLLVDWLQERYQGWEGSEQFKGTPDRLVRMYEEFCWTPEEISSQLDQALQRAFEHPYNEMLVVRDIDVWTLCPHHLLPCNFKVTIGYVPDGYVLGLSKFARVATVLGKRPIMQEEYSGELADILMEKLKLMGVAVYIVGSHGCMSARGIRQHSEVVTSILRGVFETQPETRAEFMALCRS